MLKVEKLEELSLQDHNNIIERETLDVKAVTEQVIVPMAEEFEKSAYDTLKKYTLKFDATLPQPMVLQKDDLEAAYLRVKKTDERTLNAFAMALENIKEFHSHQKLKDFQVQVGDNTLGTRYQPFDSAALYIPGGKALYPSTAAMGLVPAHLAGVENITLISPPQKEEGRVADIVAAVSYLAGATRVLQAGGAQAVLAAGLGVPELEIEPHDFIYGPGNIYVAAAKNYLFSRNICGIDSFAGPSEVVIIADESANPYYLAHDLLAQAEHDENAIAILLVTDKSIAQETLKHIQDVINKRGSDRSVITTEAIKRNGRILTVNSIEEAVEFSNKFAPEHLEIQTKDNDKVLSSIKAAGSIFAGDHAPVAIGDYFSGTNHILPTNRAARFASGVGVQSFYRRITWQKISRQGLKNSLEPITLMSKVEGLYDEHGYSVVARFENE